MTSRERLMKALNYEEADRIPIAFGGLHDSIHKYGERAVKKYLGLEGGEENVQDAFQQIVKPDSRLLERFGSDVVPLLSKNPSFYNFEYIDEGKNMVYYDQFGSKYRCPKDGGLYFDFEHCVLDGLSFEEIERFEMADPTDSARYEGIRDEALDLFNNTDKAIVLYGPFAGVFEHIYFIRGIENLYLDLASDIKMVELIAQKILDWYKAFWPIILKEVGDLVQVVTISDDLGHQSGPLFNPALYRKIFKWRHRELVDCIKKYTSAKIYYHGCGAMYEFIPDLIDIGVDILNPVQISARNMDSAILKKEFGNNISFWGGGADPRINAQGSVEDVWREVKRRVNDLKPNGGFVFASIHNIQADVPPENVVAFFDAALEYGKY